MLLAYVNMYEFCEEKNCIVHRFPLRFIFCNWKIFFQNVANTNNILFSCYVTFLFLKKKVFPFSYLSVFKNNIYNLTFACRELISDAILSLQHA